MGRPAAYAGLGYVRLRYGVTCWTPARSRRSYAIRVPVLLIHGDADQNTPAYHAVALAAAQPSAELWLVPGATHAAAWRAAPREFLAADRGLLPRPRVRSGDHDDARSIAAAVASAVVLAAGAASPSSAASRQVGGEQAERGGVQEPDLRLLRQVERAHATAGYVAAT